MTKTNTPPDRRGRPPLLAWHRVRVGGRAANGGGSAAYWSRKLAPKRFVRRGADAWRVA